MICFVEFLYTVLRVQITPAQRVLCAVCFDDVDPVDLNEADREIARLLFGDIETIPSKARHVIAWLKGARMGGTWLWSLYLLYAALTVELRLQPGEMAFAPIVAPNMKTARQGMRFALGAANSTPEIAELIESDGVDGFTLRRRDGQLVSIECIAASRGGASIRGRSMVAALMDEASFFFDEAAGVVNDSEIYRAISPRIVPGGKMGIISTAWIDTGLLWDLVEKNHADPTTCIAAIAPTLLMRDDEHTRQVVENQRELDPDNARREFDCEAGGAGAAQFFGAKELEGALDRGLAATPAIEPGWTATIGADLGLVRDSSAVVAVHSHRDGRRIMADALEFRPTKSKALRLAEIMPKIALFASMHGQKLILADHHLLTEARQHLPPGFILRPIAGGQDAKVARHVRARATFKDRRVRIPGVFARVIAQLGDIVAKPQPGGGTQITQARRRGSHGDLAAALIVALAEFEKPKNRMLRAFEDASQRAERARFFTAAGLPVPQ